MQIAVTGQKGLSSEMMKRLLIIGIGLAVQVAVIVFLLISLRHPAPRSITFAAVPNDPTACSIVKFEPFTDAWLKGFQQGSIVHSAQNSSQILNCATLTGSLRVSSEAMKVGLFGRETLLNGSSTFPLGQETLLNVSPTFPPIDFTIVALVSILTLIFDIAGITIFLRAQDRPTARITYGLFYTTSLMFSILIAYGYDYQWINLLTFFLVMMIRGLSTTFVCLFPRPVDWQDGRRRARLLPYIPLAIALLIILCSPLALILPPPQGHGLFIIATIYNIVCLIVVVWVLFWGLRNVSRNERQFARMIVLGVVFLLFPLMFALSIIQLDNVAQVSLTRLIFVPLLALPIICDYALFRHQLVGTTSLISRKVIRGLLWLLLASLFVFPSIILLHSVKDIGIPQGEVRDYIFAGILVVSLLLFPLIWGKVRDVGDQVLYHDFYQYNRSLRELSAALTRLQGLDQICSFVLPRLTTLLNASDTALLVRSMRQENLATTTSGNSLDVFPSWSLYRQPTTLASLTKERLVGVAQLALTHLQQPTQEPLILDNILLLGLYDGDTLNGFLCLGPKKNIEPYDRQDMSFLATLVAQLSVLVVNNRYLSQAQADAQKLSALNHRVVSAQEDERKHLALELHDEALQQAMLLVRQLSDASTMTEVAEAMPLARSLVTSLRQTCLELRPPLLDELGLEEALHWLAQDIGKRGKLHITVSCKGLRGKRPSASVELALYRVAQEALTNAVKHANAHTVVIRLHQRLCGESSLLICDDGRGFQRRSIQAEHFGLASMHERMEAIGGRIHVRTNPGRGVAIRATYAQPGEIATAQEEQQEAIR